MRHALLLGAAAAALASAGVADGASFSPESGIVEAADAAWFHANVVQPDDVMTVVVFYDEFSLTPQRGAEVESAAELLTGFARFVAVDVGKPGLRWLGDAYGIRVLPELMLFRADPSAPPAAKLVAMAGVPTVPRPGGVKLPLPVGAAGTGIGAGLTPEQVQKFVVSQLPDPKEMVKIVAQDKDAFDNLQAKLKGQAFVAIVSDKDKVSPLIKALAVAVRGRIQVAFVKAKDAAVLKALGIEKAPQLSVWDAEGEQHTFAGKGAAELITFVDKWASPREERAKALAAQEDAEFAMLRRKALNPVLRIESQADWELEVLNRPHVTLVAFLDPSGDSHAEYVTVLTKISKRERSTVKNVVWIDAAGQQGLMNYFGVETGGVVFLSPKYSKWTRFQGAMTVDGLNRFIDGALAKGKGAKDLAPEKLPKLAAAQ